MVPLIGGEWAEVKTLAIGTVELLPGDDGLPEAHTTDLTYFSRLADAEHFTRQAYVEAHRRGTETAKVVCAVQDGAEWLQGLVDVLPPDAVVPGGSGDCPGRPDNGCARQRTGHRTWCVRSPGPALPPSVRI